MIIRTCALLSFLAIGFLTHAQDLQPIPDLNLRRALDNLGFVRNDSLDVERTTGRLILNLHGKGISKLDGLQHFQQVWRLNLSGNNLQSLEHLPPHLRVLHIRGNQLTNLQGLPPTLETLDCSHNQLKTLEHLPDRLMKLHCEDNEIPEIGDLPDSLIELSIGGNQIDQFPCELYQQLSFFNYADNPVSNIMQCLGDTIATCQVREQNCIPIQFVDLNILNCKSPVLPDVITEVRMRMEASHSWGGGSELEEIVYNPNAPIGRLPQDYFRLNKVSSERHPLRLNGQLRVNSSNYHHDVSLSRLRSVLGAIAEDRLEITISDVDSSLFFDLGQLEYGNRTSWTSCEDCSTITITFEIYNREGELLELRFTYSGNSLMNILIGRDELHDPKQLASWLYCYQLLQLFLEKDHWLRRDFSFENATRLWSQIFH